MRYLKYAMMVGLLGFGMLLAGTPAHAQVHVGVAIGAPVYVGPPPDCAYGYYSYYPYACAPCGYYGPDYFVGGVFIGAGPWFHGYYGPRYYGGWDGFYDRDWDRWHDRDWDRHERWEHGHEFHGEGGWRGDFHHDNGWHRGGGFHGDRGWHGGEFHGGGGFHGGFHGGHR